MTNLVAGMFLFCVSCVACGDDTEYPRYSCAIPAQTDSINDAGVDSGIDTDIENQGCELLN